MWHKCGEGSRQDGRLMFGKSLRVMGLAPSRGRRACTLWPCPSKGAQAGPCTLCLGTARDWPAGWVGEMAQLSH